jgi:hypothetical protein
MNLVGDSAYNNHTPIIRKIIVVLTPDKINGLFELAGALFLLNHCRILFNDKRVAGVSVLSTFFFFSWGVWNIYYYPHLNQVWSFYGGICITVAHMIYVAMLAYYKKFPGGYRS